MKRRTGILSLLICCIITACASVDVTKTAKGYHTPTDPNEIEVLMTRPAKAYEELGTINATGFEATETAKMHNALRAKAAPLGADAIVITSSGMLEGSKQWVMGVAILYKSDSK